MGTPQYLNGSAAGRDIRLHSSGVISSGKLLLLRLPPLHHGDGHQLLVHPGVQIQDLEHLRIRNVKSKQRLVIMYIIINKATPRGTKCAAL